MFVRTPNSVGMVDTIPNWASSLRCDGRLGKIEKKTKKKKKEKKRKKEKKKVGERDAYKAVTQVYDESHSTPVE